jgi:hypothetical protein
MSTDYIINELHSLISSLSFDEYVLIDCLKFSKTPVKIFCSRLFTLDFIALTEKGFLNIYDEITNIFTSVEFKYTSLKKYELHLLNDQAMFFKGSNIKIIIKYTNKNIVDLVNLPGLDFYKCYYDGVKMYYTPEAIQCHKTKKIQYTGKLKPVSTLALTFYNSDYFCLLFIKDEFQENTDNYHIEKSFKEYNVNNSQELYTDSKQHSTECFKINQRKQVKLDFIKKYIFTNPVSTLC